MFKIIGADGREYGPVAVAQLRAWVTEGRADAQTLAQAEGSGEWKPLSAYPEFYSLPKAPPPMVTPTGTMAYPPRANGFAIAGMILGILSNLHRQRHGHRGSGVVHRQLGAGGGSIAVRHGDQLGGV